MKNFHRRAFLSRNESGAQHLPVQAAPQRQLKFFRALTIFADRR
jgi:hypothetical protein